MPSKIAMENATGSTIRFMVAKSNVVFKPNKHIHWIYAMFSKLKNNVFKEQSINNY